MTQLIVTPEAEADITEILDYLRTKAGPSIAETYRSRFLSAFRRLKAFPNSGSRRAEIDETVRIAVVYPYIIFHEVNPDGSSLTVLRVLHGRMEVEGKLWPD